QRLGPFAVFNTVVLTALFYWLWAARYASSNAEADDISMECQHKRSGRAGISRVEHCDQEGRVRVLPSLIMIATLATAVAGCASSGTSGWAEGWAERDRAWCERSGRSWRPALGCVPRGGI